VPTPSDDQASLCPLDIAVLFVVFRFLIDFATGW
jgi:hypothetical protein